MKLSQPLTIPGAAKGLGSISVPVQSTGAGNQVLFAPPLPAGQAGTINQGVQIRGMGSTANNANAKTVAVYVNGVSLIAFALTVGIQAAWFVDAIAVNDGAGGCVLTGWYTEINIATGAFVLSKFSTGFTALNWAAANNLGIGCSAIAPADISLAAMTCFSF